MTVTDQDAHAERAIEWLAREVRKICSPSLLADPVKWASDRIGQMRAEHWRCVPPDPKLTRATAGAGTGSPPTVAETVLAKARQDCETASTKIHSKENI